MFSTCKMAPHRTYYLFYTILFAIICEYYAYTPPDAMVEPLHPIGLRISIPDEHGITLVAFHVKINEDFYGLEAGQIARDIIKVRNGRWTYEDRQTTLKRDDILYYWVHVVYQGLGYNLIDQSHRVTDFYNYDGTRHIGDKPPSEPSCTTKSATWIFDKDGAQVQACPRQLLFEDNFDNLNNTNWNLVQEFAGSPDFEFVAYMTSDVTDATDGRLNIKAIPTDTKYQNEFTLYGNLNLEHCTSDNAKKCGHQASGSFILPPVVSGRINTRRKFQFLYGRVEIRAKLPVGDWVYPIITLESSMQEPGKHREIRIASSNGNAELRTPNNEIISGRVLRAGGLTVTINEGNSSDYSSLPNRASSKLWSDDYHVFEIEWKSGLVRTKVDGVQYGEQIIDGAFSKSSYLTLGVGVGGIHEFPDSTSSGYDKPWGNVEAKAVYKFYRAKDHWYPTWGSGTKLQVDYVKVWAL